MSENIKSSKYIGNLAEDQACEFLEKNMYKVVDRNWRTKYCEIDIIAEKNKKIFFVEVKYRRNSNQGGGLEAITKKKLKQMNFSAELWLASHQFVEDAFLAVISVTGDGLVDDFVVIS